MIPVISEHITTEYEGELAVVAFPRFRSKFMQKYFVPKNRSPVIRIRLDRHGTFVWQLIDGKRTVGEIAETVELPEEHRHEENLSSRVAQYIRQLQKHGFVRLKQGGV